MGWGAHAPSNQVSKWHLSVGKLIPESLSVKSIPSNKPGASSVFFLMNRFPPEQSGAAAVSSRSVPCNR